MNLAEEKRITEREKATLEWMTTVGRKLLTQIVAMGILGSRLDTLFDFGDEVPVEVIEV